MTLKESLLSVHDKTNIEVLVGVYSFKLDQSIFVMPI